LAIILLTAHFLLGILYSVVVPIWEAHDEEGHYAYVRYLATHHALPLPGEKITEWHDESHQPPLYYLLGALATFWIDTSEGLSLVPNPHTQTGQGGVNLFVHSDEEAFPYRGIPLAVHVTRLVSVSISTLVVAVTYLIGRFICPDREEIAIGAMALNAFWPQFLFVGSVVTNDALVPLFSSLVLLFLLRIFDLFISSLRDPLSTVRKLHWEVLFPAARYGFITIWASFGWGNVQAADWVYHTFGLVCLAGSLGLLLFMARSDLASNLKLSIPLLQTFFVFAVPFYMLLVKGGIYLRGRILLPAISALSLLLFLGLWNIVPQKFRKVLTGGIAAGGFALALAIPFLFILPAYSRPPILSSAVVEEIQHPLRVNFGDKMELLGYDLDTENIQAGKAVPITLYWRSLAKMERNYTISVQLLGPDYQSYGGWDTFPGRGNYATSLWRAGDIVKETYRLPLSHRFPAPGYGQIRVALHIHSTGEHLPILDAQGNLISDSLVFERFRVARRSPPEPVTENPVHYDLGNVASLTGYHVDLPALSGARFPVRLYWQARQKTEVDYTVFVHLTDGSGTLWGQHDSQPRNGYYPTSLWEEGELIEDEHLVPISPDAPPGEYHLLVGLYLLKTGERLPVFELKGSRVLHDQILIPGIQVQETKGRVFIPSVSK